ncbi:unnamed protein product [Mytilus coruscus]|uniref:Endonuclease/exonuclease/phosphatase domain-containing protein n=1 Tax=Mytilus coruscus TaxID=42192 RepID=A0A6J8BMT8_MYTCO|nr:unnamed protein product [Mytilus coruscus]
MNQASETNKIDSLVQKVDQMFQKLRVLDLLSDKISKFHSTLKTLVSNVDNVTKRVVEIEQSLEFLNTKYETSKQEHDTIKSDIKKIKQCYTDVNHGGSADRSKRDYCSGTDDLSCNEKTHTVHKDYNNICLLSLNVCGIKQTLLYPEFESLLNDYDILYLTETKLDDLNEIHCKDFIFHHKNRKKFINKSGGIALGIGNGRAGKSTSKNLSVVDYALSTAYLLKFVTKFEVLEFSKLYSDIHSPLSLVLGEIRPEFTHQNECDRNIPVRIKP